MAFSIFSTDEMLDQYPYRLRLMIRYNLIGGKIQVTYDVTNLEDKKTLPYFIGGHPGFLVLSILMKVIEITILNSRLMKRVLFQNN